MAGPSAAERQGARRAYARREIRLAWPQRVIQVGSWDWNLEAKKSTWSNGWYRILNLPQHVPPRAGTFLSCVHPDDREMVVRALGKALVGEQTYNVDHRIVWPDGTVRFVHGEAEVTFDGSGRPLRLLGIIQDLTAARHPEEGANLCPNSRCTSDEP